MRQAEKPYYVCDACGKRHDLTSSSDHVEGCSTIFCFVATTIRAQGRDYFPVHICRNSADCLKKAGEIAVEQMRKDLPSDAW